MDGAPLAFGLREHFSHSFQHTQALVANDEPHTVQAPAFQPLEEIDPTGRVLFHPLSGAENFTVSVRIYRNRHQNGCILILPAPAAPQIDAVHIDVGIPSALQRMVPPVLNMDIGFLIQLADGWQKIPCCPKEPR